METRALFWGWGSAATITFCVIGFSAIGAFIWGFTIAIRKYLHGRPSPIPIGRRSHVAGGKLDGCTLDMFEFAEALERAADFPRISS